MSHLESKGKEGGPDEEDNLKSLPAPSLFFFFFASSLRNQSGRADRVAAREAADS